MNLQDKLVQLRKKRGMSQLELAESLDVSRQAISKWELGTAIPTLENLVALSKLYGVSVDYLVNDESTSDFDIPAVKTAQAYYRLRYKTIAFRIVITMLVIACALIFGVVRHSIATAMIFILLLGVIILISVILHWLYRLVAYKNEKTK